MSLLFLAVLRFLLTHTIGRFWISLGVVKMSKFDAFHHVMHQKKIKQAGANFDFYFNGVTQFSTKMNLTRLGS